MRNLAAPLLGMLVLAYGIRATRLPAFEQHRAAERYEDTYYLPPPDWLPVMSLGYETALADLIWCRALVYFGDEVIRGRTVPYLFNYADSIIRLDPSFRSAYRWAATIALYKPGEFELDEATRAADYLRAAVRRWPNDGELAWDLGALLRFEMVPHVKDRALRRRLQEEAAEQLSAAAVLGAGPPWLSLNSSALLEKLGRHDQAIKHLEEVYATVQDETTREQIAARLARLRSQTYAEAMRVANEQAELERLRSAPYLSASLFLVLGPKIRHARMEMIERNFLPADASGALLED